MGILRLAAILPHRVSLHNFILAFAMSLLIIRRAEPSHGVFLPPPPHTLCTNDQLPTVVTLSSVSRHRLCFVGTQSSRRQTLSGNCRVTKGSTKFCSILIVMIIRLIVTALMIFEEILKLKYVQANDSEPVRFGGHLTMIKWVKRIETATTFVFGFLLWFLYDYTTRTERCKYNAPRDLLDIRFLHGVRISCGHTSQSSTGPRQDVSGC